MSLETISKEQADELVLSRLTWPLAKIMLYGGVFLPSATLTLVSVVPSFTEYALDDSMSKAYCTTVGILAGSAYISARSAVTVALHLVKSIRSYMHDPQKHIAKTYGVRLETNIISKEIDQSVS